MRPSHLHMMVEAPGYHKLITALYPEETKYLESDAVFGVKKSLVVVRAAVFRVSESLMIDLADFGTSGR